MPIKFRQPQDINAIRFGATLVWGAINGVITTIQGTSPLALVNAVAGRIKSLVQYGKCITVDDEIYCNNGKLVIVDDELPSGYKRLLGITFDGNLRYETGEYLTGNDDVTMTLDNLSTSGKNIFGSYNGANGKNFSLYIYGSASTGSYFRFGDQLKRPKYGTGKRTITFGKSGTSGFDSDSDVMPDEFTTPANVYIGMLPNSSSAAYAGDIIGSIIVSNRLEWIPCERESDGVIGYYEKYNGNFLEPVGSGSPVSLGYDTSHLTALSIEGTPEVLTIGTQTATVENLLAVDDIKDEQNIISGAVTRRCEAVISDGTTPSGRYIGTVGEGNIIVKVRESGYDGDVATFEATEAEPLNGLTVNVEPIQDLHGYDSPWPAGGGKNLFNWDRAIGTPNPSGGENSVSPRVMDTERYYVGLTRNNYYYPDRITQYSISNGVVSLTSSSGGFGIGFPVKVDPSTVYAVSYADATNAKISEGFYDADWNFLSHIDAGVTFTTPANAAYVALIVTPINVGECSLSNIQLELGSTATSFAPYSNICPISGRTSATVTRTGRNLLDVSNTTHSNYNIGSIPNTLKPNAEYTFSVNGSTPRRYRLYLARSSDPLSAVTPLTSGYWGAGGRQSFTTPNDMSDFDLLCLAGNNNGAGNESLANILPQVEVGSTASSYEPYTGNTYTIQLGDTVYGGTLDVTGGKMVVDRAMVDVTTGSDNGVRNGSQQLAYSFPGKKPGLDNFISNVFSIGIGAYQMTGRATNATVEFRVPLSVLGVTEEDSTTVRLNAIKTWLTDHQTRLCYELATPFEITLTPTQIDTLIGQNNIWSDAGSVKAYVADGDVIEHVTPQPLRTAEGNNTVAVTSAVDPVQLEVDYYKNE